MMSPHDRNLSDSMDYDDELAELHDKRERELTRLPNPKFFPSNLQDSDEDTEDASEDGDIRHLPRHKDDPDKNEAENNTEREKEHEEFREQIYFEKLNILKDNLKELEAGTLPELNRGLDRLEKSYKERLEIDNAWKEHEMLCIERDYANERLMIGREFEEKKIELRENLISELEEKKRQIEIDRYTMELMSDPTEVKPISTRKLRRRPNEPVPLPEKRRKIPQSQVTFLLDEKEIEDDFKAMQNYPMGGSGKGRKSEGHSRKAVSSDHSDYYTESSFSDTRIEDGKLFYEKRWFHRGQPIYLEGQGMPKTSGVICSISQDLVMIRKITDQTKFKVPISSLQKARLFIRRRAS